MKCWNCGHAEKDPDWGKLSFRAICEACNAALHCCRNCVYYKLGQPNDCLVPGTDFISDRTAPNFCEDFKLLGKAPANPIDPNAQKNRFNSLFRDD